MLKAALVGVIRLYQVGISAWTPAVCRFTPTCSAYAIQALEAHGALRGSWLALRRLMRCHPWGGYGYDPVPPARQRGVHGSVPASSGGRSEGDAHRHGEGQQGVHQHAHGAQRHGRGEGNVAPMGIGEHDGASMTHDRGERASDG